MRAIKLKAPVGSWVGVLLASCFAACALSASGCETGLKLECSTLPCYPSSAAAGKLHDYQPEEVFARWALPLKGTRRVWVKGSERLRFVNILGQEPTRQRLDPPFYTAVLPVQSPDIDVQFFRAAAEPVSPEKTLPLKLARAADALLMFPASSASEPFSLMTFGCFQPFSVIRDEERGVSRAIVNAGDEENPLERPNGDCQGPISGRPSNVPCVQVQLRRVMEAVATGAALEYKLVDSKTGSKQERDAAQKALAKPPVAPSLVLGSGDQLYLDAAYHTYGKFLENHPLSAWRANQAQPEARVATNDFALFVDKTYRAFWSFTTLRTVFGSLPSVFAWDDHEIRDGWGSQGDEDRHVEYYEVARRAYVAHQFALGPRDPAELSPSPWISLEQSFQVGDVPVFVLDTRSTRGRYYGPNNVEFPIRCPLTMRYLDKHRQLTMSPAQLCRFEAWAEQVPAGREFIVVVNSPLFSGVRKSSENAVDFISEVFWGDEMKDDIKDGWFADAPSEQRGLLYEIFVKARMRNKRPIIISGDVHMAVPTVAWYCDANGGGSCTGGKERSECRVLAYEMVVTGLANEEFGHPKLRIGGALGRSEAIISKEPVRSEGRTYNVEATAFIEDVGPNFGTINLSGRDSSGHRDVWLHFFQGHERQDSERRAGIHRRSMRADWERERCRDLDTETKIPGSCDLSIRELPLYQVTFAK